MARIRSIKPEFWTSERVMECSPLARLLFIGIWNFCDDAGNHPDAERSLKALIFPGDDIDSATVRRLLDELSENGLLSLYTHEGRRYLHVNGWRHQRIEKPTVKYPPFPGAQQPHNETTWPTGQVVDEQSPSGRRALDPGEEGERKGKGEDQDQEHVPADAATPAQPADEPAGDEPEPATAKTKPARGTRLPSDWTLPDDWLAWALADRPESTETAMRRVGERFRDHWIAATGKGATKLDWFATWRNWVRNERLPANTHHPPSRFTDLDQIDHEAGLERQPDGTYRIARQ